MKIALTTEVARSETADDNSNDEKASDSSSGEEESEEVVNETTEDLGKQLKAVIEESKLKRENWKRNMLDENG